MEFFETHKIQILETLILLACMFLINLGVRKWSYKIAGKFHLGIERRRITVRIFNFLTLLIAAISIMGIWGLDQKELFVFLTSALTVIGIGFFATWSILSNITSGILLYFNHPMHIGDYIKILDKEMPVEGKIKDISMFFMHIETNEGEDITIPNSVVIQKMISTTTSEENKRRQRLAENAKNAESQEVQL